MCTVPSPGTAWRSSVAAAVPLRSAFALRSHPDSRGEQVMIAIRYQGQFWLVTGVYVLLLVIFYGLLFFFALILGLVG